MKKIAPFFLLFMILSCGSDDNDLVETYEERAITVLNKSPQTNPNEKKYTGMYKATDRGH